MVNESDFPPMLADDEIARRVAALRDSTPSSSLPFSSRAPAPSSGSPGPNSGGGLGGPARGSPQELAERNGIAATWSAPAGSLRDQQLFGNDEPQRYTCRWKGDDAAPRQNHPAVKDKQFCRYCWSNFVTQPTAATERGHGRGGGGYGGGGHGGHGNASAATVGFGGTPAQVTPDHHRSDPDGLLPDEQWVNVARMVTQTYDELQPVRGNVAGARATVTFYEERFLQGFSPAEDMDPLDLLSRQAAIRVAKLILKKQEEELEQQPLPF